MQAQSGQKKRPQARKDRRTPLSIVKPVGNDIVPLVFLTGHPVGALILRALIPVPGQSVNAYIWP